MIGIFDSGAGGLSVYREIVRLLPEEKYVYYSDNAHCPYGEKTREYIIDRARSITDFLLAEGCDVIVVACNTALPNCSSRWASLLRFTIICLEFRS